MKASAFQRSKKTLAEQKTWIKYKMPFVEFPTIGNKPDKIMLHQPN